VRPPETKVTKLNERPSQEHYAQKQEIIRKQLRYEELDAEFFREHRRLNRLVRQLKKSMIKKLD
jgi:hypothetical protein